LLFAKFTLFVSNSELPKHAPYLVIGAGTAAYAAYRAIRAADATAQVHIYNVMYHVECSCGLKLKSSKVTKVERSNKQLSVENTGRRLSIDL